MIGKLLSRVVNLIVIVACIGLMLGAASLFLTNGAPTSQARPGALAEGAAIPAPTLVVVAATIATPAPPPTPSPYPTPTGPVRCSDEVWGLPLRPQGFRITAKFGFKGANSSYTKGLVGVGAVNTENAGVFHSGIDLAADTGDPVYSVLKGKVMHVGYTDQYGKHVIIENDKHRTLFAHLSQTLVKKGALVNCGQLLGLAGGTGKALTGPHLHLELREKRRDRPVDPLKLIQAAMDASSPVLGIDAR